MNNTRFPKILALLASIFLLFGCSSSSDDALSPRTGSGSDPSSELFIGSSSGSNFSEGRLEIKVSTIEVNGSTVISAFIVDSDFNLSTRSHTVTFNSDCTVQLQASFSTSQVITTTGIATTTYIDQGCPLNDSITAKITVDSVIKTAAGSVTINSPPGPTTTTVRIGLGSGNTFSNGVIELNPTSISATGSTTITVNLVDDNGLLVTTDQRVTFNSDCVNNLLANLSITSVPTSNGIASSTYTSTGCSVSDTITASVTTNGQVSSAVGTIAIAQPDAGSITFDSVSSAVIALKGNGSTSGNPETANIIFTVKDNIGTPVSGEDVTFTLNTSVTGISLVTTTATSNSNGQVVATIQPGTIAASISVTATLDSNTSLQSGSDTIVIATGPPDQDSISFGPLIFNPRAWNNFGNTVALRLDLNDRYNNPVQDGTSVFFTTELGDVDPFCTIVNGGCNITWTSGNPKFNPNVTNNAGRTTILAIVEGEETFDDTNGNGVFDDEDLGFTDMPEAFVDENEDGLHNAFLINDELPKDFNGSGTYNTANGLYNGSGCTHSTLCDPLSSAIDVRDSLVLVMSEDNPDVYGVRTNLGNECTDQSDCASGNYPSVFNLGSGGVSSATFDIAGLQNGEVLPFGTVINFGVTNGKITAGASHTINSSRGLPNPAGGLNTTSSTSFSVFLEGDTTPSTGALTIEVIIGQGGASVSFPPITLTDFPALRFGSGTVTASSVSGFNEGVLALTAIVDSAGVDVSTTRTAGNPTAGDKVTIEAVLVDINSNLNTTDTSVIFSSTCAEEPIPTASFTPPFVNTLTGQITTEYTPTVLCIGRDDITAEIIGTDPVVTAVTTVFVQ